MRQLAHRIRSILRPGRHRRPERLTLPQHKTLRRNLTALLHTKEHLTQAAGESRG